MPCSPGKPAGLGGKTAASTPAAPGYAAGTAAQLARWRVIFDLPAAIAHPHAAADLAADSSLVVADVHRILAQLGPGAAAISARRAARNATVGVGRAQP